MSKDYTAMSREELESELKRLKDEFEDMEATFEFNLMNTSAHLRTGIIEEHEQEIKELKDEIAKVEQLLKG